MIIGGDSRSRGRGFESWHRILDGHFFTYLYCCKICNVWLKRPKINDKRGQVWPIFKTFLGTVLWLSCREVASDTRGLMFKTSRSPKFYIEHIFY